MVWKPFASTRQRVDHFIEVPSLNAKLSLSAGLGKHSVCKHVILTGHNGAKQEIVYLRHTCSLRICTLTDSK